MATVKLTELMKERQLLSFELFPPKTDKGWKIFREQLNISVSSNRNTFLLHTEQAAETSAPTEKYVRWLRKPALYR